LACWSGSADDPEAQTVFLVEGLQPNWLLQRREQWAYFTISRGVSSALLVTALLAFFMSWDEMDDLMGPILVTTTAVAWSGIVTGSIEPLLVLRRKNKPSSAWKETLKRMFIYGALSALLVGIVTWSSIRGDPDHLVLSGLFGLLAGSVLDPVWNCVWSQSKPTVRCVGHPHGGKPGVVLAPGRTRHCTRSHRRSVGNWCHWICACQFGCHSPRSCDDRWPTN